MVLIYLPQIPNFYNFMERKNRFQENDSDSLWCLANRYDNHTPTRFLAPIGCSKIPALDFSQGVWLWGHVCPPSSMLHAMLLNAGMPDCTASGVRRQSGTGMKKNAVAGSSPVMVSGNPVLYGNAPVTDWDAGMPIPTAFVSMTMPSYALLKYLWRHTYIRTYACFV